MILNKLFKKSWTDNLNILAGILIFVGVIGFSDATYLTIKHYRNEIPPCSITHGCGQVTASPYSKILGIPVALLGAIYYLAVLAGTLAYLDTKNEQLLGLTAVATWAGLVMSLWFLGVQAFIIKAFCQYCLLSAVTSTLLWITGLFVIRQLDSHRSLYERFKNLVLK